MAHLYVRLCGRNYDGSWDEDIDKMSVSKWSSLLTEYNYGTITRQNIIDAFTLDAEDIIKLDVILDKPGGAAAKRELALRVRGILELGEDGSTPGYFLPDDVEAIIAGI